MLSDALKIAFQKVIESIINICIFRNLLAFSRLFFSSNFYSFALTIYLASKVRRFVYDTYEKIRTAFAKESGRPVFKFDAASFKSIDLDSSPSHCEQYTAYVRKNCESDLFNCIFSCSTHSSLVSLLTIISIEYCCSNFGMSIFQAMAYCLSISFLLCFGSSYKYTQLVVAGWLNDLDTLLTSNEQANTGSSKLNKILVTHKSVTDENKFEYVGLWLSKYDSHRNNIRVELRFLAPTYLENIKEVFDYFAKNHMKLEKSTEADNNGEKSRVEKYELCIPDYYNGGGFSKLFENEAKKNGFTSRESWTEFRIFPGVNFNIKIYHNSEKKKQKKD